jgi:hypothetical protein
LKGHKDEVSLAKVSGQVFYNDLMDTRGQVCATACQDHLSTFFLKKKIFIGTETNSKDDAFERNTLVEI